MSFGRLLTWHASVAARPRQCRPAELLSSSPRARARTWLAGVGGVGRGEAHDAHSRVAVGQADEREGLEQVRRHQRLSAGVDVARHDVDAKLTKVADQRAGNPRSKVKLVVSQRHRLHAQRLQELWRDLLSLCSVHHIIGRARVDIPRKQGEAVVAGRRRRRPHGLDRGGELGHAPEAGGLVVARAAGKVCVGHVVPARHGCRRGRPAGQAWRARSGRRAAGGSGGGQGIQLTARVCRSRG